MKRPKGFMEWELFKKIVHDASINNHSIASLHFFGEPLLWPHIVDGVALLARNRMFPRISTNGMLLTGSLARKLQDAGAKEIMVTIDTLRPEVYPKIRNGGDLSVVTKNIRDALAAAPDLTLCAQLMPSKYNKDETAEDFYKEFGSYSNFRVEPWFVIRMNKSASITDSYVHRPDEVDKRLCDKLFDRVDVLWDGTTVLCCLDAEGELVTGNMKENSISYSWLGPRAMELRKKILKGSWMELDACKQCAADHILMANESWRLTDPLKELPKDIEKLLDEIAMLDAYDATTDRWKRR
jgi:MoaA/NifB/PqqE/SkfB family radical SAM enzyme